MVLCRSKKEEKISEKTSINPLPPPTAASVEANCRFLQEGKSNRSEGGRLRERASGPGTLPPGRNGATWQVA